QHNQTVDECSDEIHVSISINHNDNTHTSTKQGPLQFFHHQRHLVSKKKVGEGRACWSLGNAYSATKNHEKALHYANRHLQISQEIGDKSGMAAAQINLNDIHRNLGLPDPVEVQGSDSNSKPRPRRKSMENMDLLKMTPDAKGMLRKYQSEDAGIGSLSSEDSHHHNVPFNSCMHNDKNSSVNEESSMDEDSFFELLSRFQSKRMDDQRCTLSLESGSKENSPLHTAVDIFPPNNPMSSVSSAMSINSSNSTSEPPINTAVQEELMEMIVGMQSRRMDEQRASLPQLPGLNNQQAILQRLSVTTNNSSALPDDNFFDMLMRCQGSRIEDQRSALPNDGHPNTAITVPDDDFFSLIIRFQSGRLEDQRSTLPMEAHFRSMA
ncbi:unnamed protein product, partial [Meganyctiphanes norvegica]